MRSWLRLVRWNNLFIIFLTQFLIWVCILLPLQAQRNDSFLLNGVNFSFICLSTILIAASGYVINDYFDIKIDSINRPEKVILGKTIHRRAALLVHNALNLLGLLFAALVAYQAGHWSWLWVQILSSILLFFYSSHLKRRFFWGNIVIALLTALSIICLYVYEPALRAYLQEGPMLMALNLPNPLWLLAIYTCFAFVLTWMREIVKDMEDHIGDAAEGCDTLPIRWGLKTTTVFVCIISLLALIPLIIAFLKIEGALAYYILVALALPLLLWVIYLPQKATTLHYHNMSKYLKGIMLLGIGSLLIYFFQAHG